MQIIKDYLRLRWTEEGGYHQVLVLAFPLILSTASWSVQHFVDRMFLTWFSTEAVAAAMPAGLLNFTLMSIFLGTAGYTSTFAAQYFGAGRFDRVGPAIWQGIYVSVFGWLVLVACIPLAGPIFKLAGHEPLIQANEVIYFQILALGAGPAIAASAMSGFFSGLSNPWPVVWVNLVATGVNVVFDYLMIFGKFGFPRWGMKGAAVATVLSAVASFIVYLILFARPAYNQRYRLLAGWRFDGPLFKRLLKFGFPNGAQFFLDVAGFTVFLFLIGRLGTVNLAATNIAFNINTLAFMPMIGVGIAVSVLVGQFLGQNRPDLAQRSTFRGFHLTLVYMSAVAALYVLVPDLFVAPFARNAHEKNFPQIQELTIVLLRFVAVYSVFDTMNIVFSSALRGAGDTRYVMFMIVAVSLLVLVIPSYIGLVVLGGSIYLGWTIASAYVIILGFSFLFRFLGGKWKSMRVIEEAAPHVLPPLPPETPGPEIG